MLPKDAGSTSISPNFTEILEDKCPHCAMAKFFAAYQNHHGSLDTKVIIGSLCELVADTIQLAKDKDKRAVGMLALQAFLELGNNITDIINDEYKADMEPVVVKRPPTNEGGLH